MPSLCYWDGTNGFRHSISQRIAMTVGVSDPKYLPTMIFISNGHGKLFHSTLKIHVYPCLFCGRQHAKSSNTCSHHKPGLGSLTFAQVHLHCFLIQGLYHYSNLHFVITNANVFPSTTIIVLFFCLVDILLGDIVDVHLINCGICDAYFVVRHRSCHLLYFMMGQWWGTCLTNELESFSTGRSGSSIITVVSATDFTKVWSISNRRQLLT